MKVDDISRPYDDVQKAEIEAIRKAIDKTGRPIVLSLSPGDTPVGAGAHVNRYANMWRISDDFWDRWHAAVRDVRPPRAAGPRTAAKVPGPTPTCCRSASSSSAARPASRRDEQLLCMTLWSIARSPLIFGGDMTKLDAFTLELLTNPEVLAVNQASTNNRQVSRDGDLIVWAADVPDSRDRYVALFNAQGTDVPYDLAKAAYKSPVLRGPAGRDVADISVPIAGATVARPRGDRRRRRPVLRPRRLDRAHAPRPQGHDEPDRPQVDHRHRRLRPDAVNRTAEDRPLRLNGKPS